MAGGKIMNNNPLLALRALGQHVWLDNLSRTLLREGGLQALITADGVDGVTTNPAIFEKAITGSAYYREDLVQLQADGFTPEASYEALVIADVRAACALFWPAYLASAGETGYVSLEVSPELANDTEATINAARRLQREVGRQNVLIKVPGTTAGLQAFEQLTAEGIKINVTLLFSLAQYEATAQAYLRGAGRWLASGGDGRQLRSVASVFLSRVDTLVDQRLNALGTTEALVLQGRAGVALARDCYRRYREIFHGAEFSSLRAAGIRPQTPLWASTGSKNPAAGELCYVEPLIGGETITTLPEATLAAFRAGGQVAETLLSDIPATFGVGKNLADLGVDRNEVGETLQKAGLELFAKAYGNLLISVTPKQNLPGQ